MKKKIVFLSALSAVSFGMTSCIDNDEPAGLEEMRKAKANELNGQAAERNANAEFIKAQTQSELAAAALAQANVIAQEIANKSAEVDLAVKSAQSEVTIQAAKDKLEEMKITLQTSLANAEALRVKAEAALATATEAAAETVTKAELSAYSFVTTTTRAALKNLNAAADTVNIKAEALKNAQAKYSDALLAFTNGESEQLNSFEDAVENAEYDLLVSNKAVELAERNLAKFNAVDTADLNAWSELYNECEDAKIALDKEIAAYDVKIAAATADAAEAADVLKDLKKDANKELDEYKQAEKVHKFETKNADVIEALGAKDAEVKLGGFTVSPTGIIVSKDAISNGDYTDAKGVAVNGLEKQAKDLIEKIEKNVYSEATSAMLAQELVELEKHLATYKTAYEADVKTYDAAVKAYKAAAEAILWSFDAGKSLTYESTKAALEGVQKFAKDQREAITKIQTSTEYINAKAKYNTTKAQLAAWGDKPSEADKASDAYKKALKDFNEAATALGELDDKIAALVAERDAKFNAFAKDLRAYMTLRTAFDGFDGSQNSLTAWEYTITVTDKNGDEKSTDYKFAYKDFSEKMTENECNGFESFLAAKVEDLIGTAKPSAYDAEKGYGLLLAKGDKLMGGYMQKEVVGDETADQKGIDEPRYIQLTAEELDYIYDNKAENLKGAGSQGLYEWAVRYIADKKADVANQADYAALLKAVVDVVEANQAKIDELTAAATAKYATFQKEIDAVAAANKVVADLKAEQKLVSSEKGYVQTLQTAAAKLAASKGVTVTNGMVTSAVKEGDVDENFDLVLEYYSYKLAQAIVTAEQGVADKEVALAKAKANLAEFKAEDGGDADLIKALATAETSLNKAKNEYDAAVAVFALAEAEYNATVEALKADAE